jgi:RHS repeat-associated protein
MPCVPETGSSTTATESGVETGLYYNRARYYDPAMGRFLSEDPIGFDSDSNFYRYVRNNPTNGIDPTGLDCRTIGSLTYCWNQHFDWQKKAEDAHESAHRDAGLKKQLDPRACPDLEADAFKREVDSGAYQKRLKELNEKTCLTDKEKAEKKEVEERLSAAKDNSDRRNAVQYCRNTNPMYKGVIK